MTNIMWFKWSCHKDAKCVYNMPDMEVITFPRLIHMEWSWNSHGFHWIPHGMGAYPPWIPWNKSIWIPLKFHMEDTMIFVVKNSVKFENWTLNSMTHYVREWESTLTAAPSGVGQSLVSVMTSDMPCDSITQPISWDIEFVLSTSPIQSIFCYEFDGIKWMNPLREFSMGELYLLF